MMQGESLGDKGANMDLSCSEYKAIVESSPNMIWRAGTDAKCNFFNATWLRFTGKTQAEEVGDGWVEGVHPEDVEKCVKRYMSSFVKREAFEMEYRLRRFDGQYRWINDRGIPFFDSDGVFIGYIGSCMDVTERVEGRKLIDMAHNDRLTGLYNRNYLDYLISHEFHSSRQTGTSLMIMMLDIDAFKLCNDRYGHSFGDRVLSLVAERISENIRKTDTAGRYGGDEFLIILPEATIDDAKAVAQRILEAVNQMVIGDSQAKISVSIGIADKTNEKEINDLIEKADIAMYRAKRDGGNDYRLYAE